MPAIPSKANPLASNLSPLGLRITRLGELLGKLGPIPAEWLEDVNKASKAGTKTKPLECLSCSSWTEVVGAWKRALKWTEGLDCALACMFSSVLSTNLVGEQLWFEIIGPPSCLEGETPIFDPVANTTKSVKQRWEEGNRFWVYTKKPDGTLGVAEALPPERKGIADLYKLEFESGRTLIVTAGHRIWNGDSYVAVHAISDALQSSSSYPLPSISEFGLSTQMQDVLHSLRTAQDFQESCFAYSCLDGEPPRSGEDTYQSSPPLPYDVQASTVDNGDVPLEDEHRCSHPSLVARRCLPKARGFLRSHRFGGARKLRALLNTFGSLKYWCGIYEHTVTWITQLGITQPSRQFDTQAILCSDILPLTDSGSCLLSSDSLPISLQSEFENGLVDTLPKPYRRVPSCLPDALQRGETLPQPQLTPSGLFADLPLESFESQQTIFLLDRGEQFDTQQESSAQRVSVTRVEERANRLLATIADSVIKVTPIKRDYYYDFCVPETHNYWAQGVFHHNSGKTTLLEGISVNKKYVLSKDTIRGFYSGWKDEQGNDVSLIQEAMGKTLAMKEGDAFIKAPTCQQILSEGRGIYDRVGRVHYRNATANDYEGARMTWIICGTSAIREEIDGSELGARFLCCVVMDGIDDDFEDDVLWRAVNQEARNMLSESNGDASGQHPEELSQAMSLTGGYVSHLRENTIELISSVSLGDDQLRYCGRLGKFIAFMRARPSKKEDHPEREFGARLGKQLTRLAVSIAAVTNDTELSPSVMNRVKRIGMDTARGLPLSIARRLRFAETNHSIGLPVKALSDYLNQPEEKVKTLIRFLRHIGVVEQDKRPTAKKTQGTRWKLTGRFLRLYYEVDDA